MIQNGAKLVGANAELVLPHEMSALQKFLVRSGAQFVGLSPGLDCINVYVYSIHQKDRHIRHIESLYTRLHSDTLRCSIFLGGHICTAYIIQLWPFVSYNWLFQWDYTFYKWGYKML